MACNIDIKQEVIDTATQVLKRYGYCDFCNDGSFDPGTETQIEHEQTFDDDKTYVWNGSTFEEQ